jgi:hypothetical protein
MSGKSVREAAEAKSAAKFLREQEARRAMSEYEADARRVDQNTARLRALRLAKEAAEVAAETKPAAAKPGKRAKRAPASKK